MTNWAALLEEDLRWREAELASLKRIAIVSSDNEITYRATLRASWAMLYAHFEGFTKFCWDILLDQVQVRKVSIDQLNENFRLLALEKAFRELKRDISSPSIWEFYNGALPELLKSNAIFPSDCRLDAASNLWPNVFERECSRVGIKSDQIGLYRGRIKSLVARRNDIAHGMTMTIKSVSEYSEYEHAALLVLHDLAVQILSILENETFIAANNSPT